MTTLARTRGDKVAATAAPNPANPARHILGFSDEAAVTPDGSEYALNIAGVYEDSVTRDWAMQACRTGTQRAGEEHVQKTWYNVNSLCDPRILLDAVRAAVVADVIVVSVYAASELPLGLYVWIDVWLPRRLSRAGALAALIGVAEPADSHSVRTQEYLQAVARKGQLDYIPQERKRPVAFPVSPMDLVVEQAGTAAPVLQEIQGQRCDSWSRGSDLPNTPMRLLRPKR